MLDGSTQALAAQLVRGRRRHLGLSQRELALAAGVSIGMIRDLEQGRTGRPHPSTLNRLCTSLELEVDLLTRPEPDPTDAEDSSFAAPCAKGELELLVLGSFEVRRGGASVKLPNGKPRTLLAVLALNAGKAVHQDTLINLLWGEAPPARAHRRLGEYVRTTRQTLAPGRPAGRRSSNGSAAVSG